jgi:hypothetical protein
MLNDDVRSERSTDSTKGFQKSFEMEKTAPVSKSNWLERSLLAAWAVIILGGFLTLAYQPINASNTPLSLSGVTNLNSFDVNSVELNSLSIEEFAQLLD